MKKILKIKDWKNYCKTGIKVDSDTGNIDLKYIPFIEITDFFISIHRCETEFVMPQISALPKPIDIDFDFFNT